jgi:glutathione S-transferase
VKADVRRIVDLWRDCRSRYGAGGAFLFGAFSAADAMYAPVVSRFRTYLPDLGPYGDDGTAQAYVATIFAVPAMAEWEAAARLDPRPG